MEFACVCDANSLCLKFRHRIVFNYWQQHRKSTLSKNRRCTFLSSPKKNPLAHKSPNYHQIFLRVQLHCSITVVPLISTSDSSKKKKNLQPVEQYKILAWQLITCQKYLKVQWFFTTLQTQQDRYMLQRSSFAAYHRQSCTRAMCAAHWWKGWHTQFGNLHLPQQTDKPCT